MWTDFDICSQEDVTVSQTYCTNGLFKIRSSIPVLLYPEVKSSVQNERMLVAIDKNVILFANEQECHVLNYDFHIDCVSTANFGQIVLCCLGNGQVHGSFINGIPAFDLSVDDEDVRDTERTFIGIHELENSYYLMCSSGALYVLDNMSELPNQSQQVDCGDGTLVYDDTLLSSVEIRLVYRPISKPFQVSAFTVFNTAIQFRGKSNTVVVVVFCDSDSVYTVSINGGKIPCKVRLPKACGKIKKIINLKNYVLLLNCEGYLFDFCPETKLIEKRPAQDPIDDITVLENNLVDGIEMMALTRADSSKKKTMKILNFPEMKSSYALTISEHCWLVTQPKSALNMYYLNGSVSGNQNPDEIEMKKVSELHPNQRFKKLISRGLFDEAEQFAMEFGLSLELIHEHRVHAIVKRIRQERNLESLNLAFQDLIQAIEKVKDLKFLANLNRINIPSRKLMETFLNYLSEKLVASHFEEKNVLNDIEEQLRRLDTLHLIDPYECNVDWQNFLDNQILVKKLMASGIQVASLIWSRHSSSIVPYLTTPELTRILASIPEDTEFIELLHWLRHISRGLVEVHPHSLEVLVEWGLQKTKTLESSSLWPANGLQFLRNMYTTFKGLEFLVLHFKRHLQENLAKIQNFITVLEELDELKGEYNLSIKLDSYMNADLDKKTLNLLQRVQINNLQKLVSSFIFPLFIKNNQSPKNALISFVQFLIVNRKFTSLWQHKAVTVIQQMPNEDDRVSCACQVLNVAPVPWISDLHPLIAYGHLSHPLAGEILSKYELQVVKIVKTKYNYPLIETGNPMQLIFRIVKVGHQDMVLDLKALIKAMPNLAKKIYMYCIPHLIRHDQLEKALILFNEVDKEESEYLIQVLVKSFEMASLKEMSCVIEFLNIVNSRKIGDDIKKTIRRLDSVFKLKRDFNVCIYSLNDLDTLRFELVDNGIGSILESFKTNPTANENAIDICFSMVSSLSHLLRVNVVEAVIKISHRVNRLDLSWCLANCLLDSVEVDSKVSDYLLELAMLLLAQDINESDQTTQSESTKEFPVYPMVYKILSSCISVNILDSLAIKDLLRVVHIGSSLYNLDEINTFYRDNKDSLSSALAKFLSANKEMDEKSNGKNKRKCRESFSVFDQSMQTVVEFETTRSGEMNTNRIFVLQTLRFVLQIISMNNNRDSICQFLENYLNPRMRQNTCENLVQAFSGAITQLYQGQLLQEMHSIFDEVLKLQKLYNLNIITEQHVTVLNKKLLKMLLSTPEVDINECFFILIKHAPSEILSGLEKDMRTVVQKANFCGLAELFCFSVGKLEEAASLKARRIKYKYFLEITSLNPGVKMDVDAFNVNALPYLKMEVRMLEKMCHEFGCSFQDMLMSQVLQILQSQELRFKIDVDDGVERLKLLITVEEILLLCTPLVNEIQTERTQLFTKKLIKFAEQIDSFFYEMYLVVIEILLMMDTLPEMMAKWKDMLHFLQHKMVTRRRVRPSQAEFDWWLKSQNDLLSSGGGLPRIAKFRFPFLRVIKNIQETLLVEVNVENCVSWFPLMTFHSLLRGLTLPEEIEKENEVLCTTAVRNSVAEWKIQVKDKKNNDVWHLMPQYNAFLQSILRLVQHMGSKCKIFSILYFTMNQMPEGADQVDSAYACYKYGVENVEAVAKDTMTVEALNKIQRKYPILKTQHLLHLHGFAEDRLMNLIEKPTDLIVTLYLHPMILNDVKPDVNGLALGIAQLHSLPLHAIQKMMVQKLLNLEIDESMSTSLADESVILVQDTANVSDHLLKQIGQMTSIEASTRAYYIIISWPHETSFSFLLPRLHGIDMDQMNNPQVLKNYLLLFECLAQYLATGEAKDLAEDVLDQEDYLTFKILYLLHKINFRYEKKLPAPDMLNNTDKIDLLKVLWQNHSGSEQGLEVMALICMRYSIDVKNVWNGVIKKMISLKMVKHLRALIDMLATKKNLLIMESLPSAYQFVMKEPLLLATSDRTPDQEASLCRTLLLLESCPISSKLNLLELVQMFFSLDRPYMAAAVLPFIADGKMKRQVLELLGPHKNQRLKRDIEQLVEFGVMSLITKAAINELFQKDESEEQSGD